MKILKFSTEKYLNTAKIIPLYLWFLKKTVNKMNQQKITRMIRGLTDIKVNVTMPALALVIIIVVLFILLK